MPDAVAALLALLAAAMFTAAGVASAVGLAVFAAGLAIGRLSRRARSQPNPRGDL